MTEQLSDAEALQAGQFVKCVLCGRWVSPGDTYEIAEEETVICGDCVAAGLGAGDLDDEEVYPEPVAGLCLGFLRLDRNGDQEPAEVACVDCGQGCDAGIWLAAIANGRGRYELVGPFCDLCASSE